MGASSHACVVSSRAVSSCYGANEPKERQQIRIGDGTVGGCRKSRGWMWWWSRTALISTASKWVSARLLEQNPPRAGRGERSEALGSSPARTCTAARMCEHRRSAAVSKQLIKSLSALCVSKAEALQNAKGLHDSQVQRPGGSS